MSTSGPQLGGIFVVPKPSAILHVIAAPNDVPTGLVVVVDVVCWRIGRKTCEEREIGPTKLQRKRDKKMKEKIE